MRSLKLFALALLLPSLALANGYSLPNVNARDLGVAGSAVAAQRDAAATWGNPASLAGLSEGLNLSLSMAMLDLGSKWTGDGATAGQTASMKFNPQPPPAMYVGWGGRTSGGKGWGVGLGLTIPAGGAVSWPADWPGRFRIVSVDRKVYGVALTGGFQVLPQLKLGGGLIYYRTTELLKQQVDYSTSEGAAEVSTAGGKATFDLSLEFTPVAGLAFAVDYKEKGTQSLKGKAHFADVPVPLQATLIDQGVTHELSIPRVLNVGVSYRATKPLLLMATFTYDFYSVYKDDTFKGDLSTSCPSATCIVVGRNYGDGKTFRFGAEYDVNPAFQVRAGVLRDLSGLKTDTFSPTLPDGSSWAVSGGLTWNFKANMSANLGVFYAMMDKVTVTGAEAFPGSFETTALLVAASVTYRPATAAK